MLKIDSVQLEFGSRSILHDVYLDCKAGQVTGLLGRNGCGKSSLLRIIFGTLKPAYKHISIDDKLISKAYTTGKVAYLPQHNFLPQNTPLNQLARMLVDENAWEEFCNYDIFKKHGHYTADELSGGELRKFEIMMILYSRADYILLDEPFTHVSPVQADEIKDIIRKRSAFKGFIITDHQYYNILEVSNKIVLLNNGATRPISDQNELVTYGYLSGNQ